MHEYFRNPVDFLFVLIYVVKSQPSYIVLVLQFLFYTKKILLQKKTTKQTGKKPLKEKMIRSVPYTDPDDVIKRKKYALIAQDGNNVNISIFFLNIIIDT